MPELEKHQPVLYDPSHPYHWEFDNLPLHTLIDRDRVINDAVDINSSILRDSHGSQGSLSKRLNKSLNSDGTLKATAVDDIEHNIGAHTDGTYEGIEYVRMKADERDKLTSIAEEATDITLEVETISNSILFDEGPIILEGSATLTWAVNESNRISANLSFPVEAAHKHYYDMSPVTTDYINYKVTTTSTPYMNGSLRVFINGIRLVEDEEIYVPGNLASDAWVLMTFTSSYSTGTFTLSTAISEDDIIAVDFDVALT